MPKQKYNEMPLLRTILFAATSCAILVQAKSFTFSLFPCRSGKLAPPSQISASFGLYLGANEDNLKRTHASRITRSALNPTCFAKNKKCFRLHDVNLDSDRRRHTIKLTTSTMDTSLGMKLKEETEDDESRNSSPSNVYNSQIIDDVIKFSNEEDEDWYKKFKSQSEDMDTILQDGIRKIEDIRSKLEKRKASIKSISVQDDDGVEEERKYRFNGESKWKVGKTNGDGGESNDLRDKIHSEREQIQRTKEEVDIKDMNGDVEKELSTNKSIHNNDETAKETVTKERESGKHSTLEEAEEILVVQYKDIYQDTQTVPLLAIQSLGYTTSEIINLQSEALDLILEDGIRKPEKGIPPRWMVTSTPPKSGEKICREIRVLKRRRKKKASSDEIRIDEVDDGDMGKSRSKSRRIATEERLRTDAKMSSFTRKDDPRMKRRRKSKMKNSTDSQRRGKPKNIQAMSKKDDRTNKFWMDLPTFKQYLRREAELRLMILGPDWKDWVKGESDWRLNLYKNWLAVLDEGVGDDLFENMSYAPYGSDFGGGGGGAMKSSSNKERARLEKPRNTASTSSAPNRSRSRSRTSNDNGKQSDVGMMADREYLRDRVQVPINRNDGSIRRPPRRRSMEYSMQDDYDDEVDDFTSEDNYYRRKRRRPSTRSDARSSTRNNIDENYVYDSTGKNKADTFGTSSRKRRREKEKEDAS